MADEITRAIQPEESEENFRPSGPRVAGLAEPRFLNDAFFNGYEDVTIRPPVVKLTDQDLDDIKDTGMTYYADDDNDCAHKPDVAITSFGMDFIKIGEYAFIQVFVDKLTGKVYMREFDGFDYDQWSLVYTAKHKPLPADIGAISTSGVYAKNVNDSFIPKVDNTVVEGGGT